VTHVQGVRRGTAFGGRAAAPVRRLLLSREHWRVEGALSLHGHSVPLSFEVTGTKERFRGLATVSQRAFGIKPISAGGGTVNVKNDVKVDFDIATASP